jgi:hypothetical protein
MGGWIRLIVVGAIALVWAFWFVAQLREHPGWIGGAMFGASVNTFLSLVGLAVVVAAAAWVAEGF